MRLRKLEWRDTDLSLERSPQMPLTDTKVPSELSDRAVVERACRNAVRRHVRETRYGIHDRAARRKLRTAACVASWSHALRGRRSARGRRGRSGRNARGADGPAVHARRRDADEEQPVESCVSRA
jgi:hypothetical protein